MRKVGFDKVWFDKMGNVIGRIGKGKTKIMIDSTSITVHVGEPQPVEVGPVSKGSSRMARFTGRGACDRRHRWHRWCNAGEAIQQPNVSRRRDRGCWIAFPAYTIDATMSSGRTRASVNLAILELALERVPLPLAAVADVHGIDVGIDHDLGLALPMRPIDVRILSNHTLSKPLAHFLGDALADIPSVR